MSDLVVVRQHLDDRAVHLSADGMKVPLKVGVVRLFEAIGVAKIATPPVPAAAATRRPSTRRSTVCPVRRLTDGAGVMRSVGSATAAAMRSGGRGVSPRTPARAGASE